MMVTIVISMLVIALGLVVWLAYSLGKVADSNEELEEKIRQSKEQIDIVKSVSEAGNGNGVNAWLNKLRNKRD